MAGSPHALHVASFAIVGKKSQLNQKPSKPGLLRHVRACNNVDLPGDRIPFLITGQQVGWVTRPIASILATQPTIHATPPGIGLRQPKDLPALGRLLADMGQCRWRGEAFDVRVAPDAPVLATIDRGAIPAFGIQAVGVHINGLVRRPDGLHVWVARRAQNKSMDPGKLDHVVAGGVPAGLSPMETVVKEAGEEASIPPDIASRAQLVGAIAYAMQRPEGLRRDWVYCYDLELPAGFVPQVSDGEVEAFELWPIERVLQTVRDTDAFKFNVNLVLIDLFLRQGLVAGDEAAELRAALQQP